MTTFPVGATRGHPAQKGFQVPAAGPGPAQSPSPAPEAPSPARAGQEPAVRAEDGRSGLPRLPIDPAGPWPTVTCADIYARNVARRLSGRYWVTVAALMWSGRTRRMAEVEAVVRMLDEAEGERGLDLWIDSEAAVRIAVARQE